MADLSSFTDQERALLAQYLALKAGSPANAGPLIQQVLSLLAGGQHGSTLTEVIAGLVPEGIPPETDFSAYLDIVNGGAAQPAPQQQSDGGGSYSPAEPFLPNGGVTLSGSLLPILEQLGLPGQEPAAPRPPAGSDDGGLFGIPMSPSVPPQGAPPPPREQSPLGPGPGPARDPRTASVAPPASANPGPAAAPTQPTPQPAVHQPLPVPAPLDLPTPIAPPALPPLAPEYQPAGTINPNKTTDRLPAGPLDFDPTVAPPTPLGRVPDSVAFGPTTLPTRPTAAPPLASNPVQTVPINPRSGNPVDFADLTRTALQRDVAGPFDYSAIDSGVSAMSGMAGQNVAQPAPQSLTSAPGAGVTPEQRNAMSALPHPSDIIPPIQEPLLTEHVLRDWIKGGGLDRPAPKRDPFDLSVFPAADPAQQSALENLAAQRRPSTSAPGAGVAPEQRTAMSTLPPVAPSPAPLPAARRAVAAALPEHTINLTPDEREMLARAVATEVDPRAARIDPSAYEKQVYRTVDTMLNREASGQFGEFDDLVSVLNQPFQFSAIAGPKNKKGERYGVVENIPPERASPALREMVDAWVEKRMAGEPSSVGGALHYANPKAADPSNLEWIKTLEGPRDEAGPFSHWYGTTEGFTPVEAKLRNPARDAQPSATSGPWMASLTQRDSSREPLGNAFNVALQSAAQRRDTASEVGNAFTSPHQRVTSPTGRSITVAQRNAFSGGGGSSSSVGDPFTSPGRSTSSSQGVRAPTGGSVTVGQRNAIGGYTAPSSSRSSSSRGRTTSPTQRVTSPTGRTITVAQRNAFSGY